ncbi:MAG TPA: hypothetical protein VND91_05030 [Candidatus Saccharimonadia bacterium]|nr:hypothetical protein [Candidatus Saccharimonadia bacterium]
MSSRIRGVVSGALAIGVALALAGCAATARYSPDVVRLQDELARIEGDDRIALRAERELAEAGDAVERLRTKGRRLGDEDFDHGVYVAERLIAIAAAEGLARDAERRARFLSTEREALLIDARTREAHNVEDELEDDEE